ncbi:Protein STRICTOSIDINE SYNTHASE-LIKE 10 [Bienertia sinuspersici]
MHMQKQFAYLVLLLLHFASNQCNFLFHAQAYNDLPIIGRGLGSQPRMRQYNHLPLGLNANGPESTTFDCDDGGPYVGVSDGRILKWDGSRWTVFAITSSNRSNSCDGVNNSPAEQYCGRPLGLKFDMKSCELYIADASYGLVKVDRNGGVATSLATGAEGIPFHFLNDLDIDSQSGVIYLTDTSSTYHRWQFPKAIATFERSGRLIKYDIKTKALTVLLKGLYFANGVALSKNKDFILVVETSAFRIQRYWLNGPKVGTSEVFLQVFGLPDNINRNADGDFWIANHPNKSIKVDENGTILESLVTIDAIGTSDIVEFHDSRIARVTVGCWPTNKEDPMILDFEQAIHATLLLIFLPYIVYLNRVILYCRATLVNILVSCNYSHINILSGLTELVSCPIILT